METSRHGFYFWTSTISETSRHDKGEGSSWNSQMASMDWKESLPYICIYIYTIIINYTHTIHTQIYIYIYTYIHTYVYAYAMSTLDS